MPDGGRVRLAPLNDYLKIKAASRDLQRDCGGGSKCALITRGHPSHLSEAASPGNLDRFLCIDQVLDLELECGVRHVTDALADLHGCDVVSRTPAKPEPVSTAFARMLKECNEAESTIATAIADGDFDREERAASVLELREALEKIRAMIASLEALS
jgi:hypothetical protein